jgi:hypothetical protein
MAGPADDSEASGQDGGQLDRAEAVDAEVVDESPQIGDARMVQAVQMLTHQGPLPSSDWFAAVEPLAAGTTKALVDDYVAERRHQRRLQSTAVAIDRENFLAFTRYQNRQLFAAWSVVTIIAGGGIALIATGHSIAGLVYLVSELAILAGVFIGRQVLRSRNEPPAPTA